MHALDLNLNRAVKTFIKLDDSVIDKPAKWAFFYFEVHVPQFHS